jgi:thymidylate synthase
MSWPLSCKGDLIVGSSKSNNAICCLWADKRDVEAGLSSDLYRVIGQCYSRVEGVSEIVRNCLADKMIRRVFVYGRDGQGSGEVLLSLKRGEDVKLREDIPAEAVSRFRENVDIVDVRDNSIKDLESLLGGFDNVGSWGENEFYERVAPRVPGVFPSEKSGMVVRGTKVWRVWLDVLDSVLRFGTVKPSEYSDDQIELPGFMSIVTKEDPNRFSWNQVFSYFPDRGDLDRGMTRDSLREYLPKLLTSEKVDDSAYGYGQRLREYFGVNQVDRMKAQLSEALFTRRAVGVTWDALEDGGEDSPCLDLIQVLVRDNTLDFTGYFRSNDMMKAWPKNAAGLRYVQKEISDYVGCELGDLCVVSNSAHIYSSDWDAARELLREFPVRQFRNSDPRGNVLIGVDGKKIKVSHLSPSGDFIQEFFARDAKSAYKGILDRKMISVAGHYLDIGVELGKAESAIRLGSDYVQDEKL